MSDQYFTPTRGMFSGQILELSGWWRRVGALVVDAVVIVIPLLILLRLAGFGGESIYYSLSTPGDVYSLFAFFAAALIVPPLYYCWIMSATNGQTVGKRAFGIRVVRENGYRVDSGFAFLRQVVVIGWGFGALGGGVLLGLPIYLDYLWPLWDTKHQALHDKIVKSRVVLAVPHAVGAPVAPSGYHQRSQVNVPAVSPEHRYVAPQPNVAQPAPPAAPPAPPYSPPPPPPEGTATPYTPPPGFDSPVPEDG